MGYDLRGDGLFRLHAGSATLTAPAIEHFQSAIDEEILPIDADQKMRFSIAQLYASIQKWPEVISSLEGRGHVVDRSPRHWSAAEVIVVDHDTGWHLGGADPRTDGAAVGVSAGSDEK